MKVSFVLFVEIIVSKSSMLHHMKTKEHFVSLNKDIGNENSNIVNTVIKMLSKKIIYLMNVQELVIKKESLLKDFVCNFICTFVEVIVMHVKFRKVMKKLNDIYQE